VKSLSESIGVTATKPIFMLVNNSEEQYCFSVQCLTKHTIEVHEALLGRANREG